MEKIVKIRCPYCNGKIAIEEDYYQELVGTDISCPHCDLEITILDTPDRAKYDESGIHRMSQTMKVQLPANAMTWAQTKSSAKHDAARCPYCDAEVGKRDRVCIACGGRISSSEHPSGGFKRKTRSQTRS